MTTLHELAETVRAGDGDALFDLALTIARAQFCPDRPLDPPEYVPERDFGDRADDAYEARVAAQLDRSTP